MSSSRRPASWRPLCLAIGQRVRRLREEQDISSSELAAAIGYSSFAVMSWERGDRMPSMVALCMTAAALRCPPIHLIPDEFHHQCFPVRE